MVSKKYQIPHISKEVISVGGDKTAFEPKLNIDCFLGESKLSLLPQVKSVTETVRASEIEAENSDIRFLWKPTGIMEGFNEDGGIDIIITLLKKPAQNYIDFGYDTTHLVGYHQPELTSQEISEGHIRPAYVVNSIAWYHDTKGGMVTQADVSKHITTGKAGHTYRMMVQDALGNKEWANWTLKAGGVARLWIDNAWLKKAEYPVVISPVGDTFGRTYEGGTSGPFGTDTIRAFTYSGFAPAASGTLHSMMLYCKADSGATIYWRPVVYKNSDNSLIGYGEEYTTTNNSMAWREAAFDSGSVVGSTQYNPSVWIDSVAANKIYLGYDTGQSGYSMLRDNETYHSTNPPPSTFSVDATSDGYRVGCYVIYEPTLTPIDNVSTVYPFGGAYATRVPFQEKAFYVEGRYWAFFSDGTNIYFKSSTDNETWEEPTLIGAGSGYEFTSCFDGTYVHYFRCLQSISQTGYYRRGAPQSDGSITWSAVEQSAASSDGSHTIGDPDIIVDSNGYAWISYPYSASDYSTSEAHVVKNANNDGTWSEDFDTTMKSVSAGNEFIPIQLVALTSGKVYAVYHVSALSPATGDTILLGQLYNSGWGSEENVTSHYLSENDFDQWVTIADGDDVMVAFLAETSDNLESVIRTYGVGWGSEETIDTSVDDDTTPFLAKDDSNIYCFWIVTDSVYVSKYDGGWGAPSEIVEDTNGIYSPRLINGAVDDNSGEFIILYMTDYIDYQVRCLTYTPGGGGGWTNIAKVNGIASSNIAKVTGIGVSNISKVNGVTV
jgi:hypothetical protein